MIEGELTGSEVNCWYWLVCGTLSEVFKFPVVVLASPAKQSSQETEVGCQTHCL